MKLVRITATTGMTLAIMAAVVGCGRRAAPNPELLGQQMTIELLDAIAAGDLELAENKVAKLGDLWLAAPGSEELLRLVVDNAALAEAQKEETPTAALRLLDAVRSQRGSSARLDDAAYELMDLELVAAYAAKAWPRPGPMALAVSDLPPADRWSDSIYGDWLAGEKRTLARLQKAERQRLIDNLIRTLDRTLVAGDDSGAAAAMAQMRRLAPAHAVVGGDDDAGRAEALEFAAWRAVRGGRKLPVAMPDQAQTLSGKGALALAAVRRGDRVRGLRLWRELKEAFSPADDRILARATLASARGGESLQAVPTASGMLRLLAIAGSGVTDFKEQNTDKGD